ncbi:GNAT family N-acetyltransferase [Vibrio aphrogenes]|uniref:GNAT family N-acetyltransferase n=1 Tax=Vibrio aphrogenes TaxID=1891186 RepID=UPI000B360270|nr:GNAT family N-acetyltransferase [Vibrio aphrogenes]
MPTLKHDPVQHRYEVEVVEGFWAHLDYTVQGEVWSITHTFVPDELRGQGCGKVLMENVLTDIQAQGKKIRPICSYAVVYLQRHPQWQHLLVSCD